MLATPADKRDARAEVPGGEIREGARGFDVAELIELDADFKKAAEEHSPADGAPAEAGCCPGPTRSAPCGTGASPRRPTSTARAITRSPGRLVGPGVPSVLTDGKTPFVVKPPWPGAKKTGRRLALARWLAGPTTRSPPG